ncbi:hypothetical protein HK101_009806, partial [Irineochytrium annulatum]
RFQCPHCPKRFSRPSSLTTHVYTHTGERPHACATPGCTRSFSVLSNLRRHARVCARNLAKRNKAANADGGAGGDKGGGRASPNGSDGASETDGIFEPKRTKRQREDGMKEELEDGELAMEEADDSAGDLTNGSRQHSNYSGNGGLMGTNLSSGSSSSGSGSSGTGSSGSGNSRSAGGAYASGSGSDEEARRTGRKKAKVEEYRERNGIKINMMSPSF